MNTKKLWAELRRSWVFNHKRHHEYIQTIPGAQNLDAPWKWVVKGSFWTSTLWDWPSRNPSLETLRNRQRGFTRIFPTPWLLNLSWELGSPMRRQWHPATVLLPGKSHGWRSLVGCSPWAREVGHNWATSLSLFTFMHWRRKWQPTPVFLLGKSQRRGSLVGCRLWGCTESDTTEAT